MIININYKVKFCFFCNCIHSTNKINANCYFNKNVLGIEKHKINYDKNFNEIDRIINYNTFKFSNKIELKTDRLNNNLKVFDK